MQVFYEFIISFSVLVLGVNQLYINHSNVSESIFITGKILKCMSPLRSLIVLAILQSTQLAELTRFGILSQDSHAFISPKGCFKI